MEIPSNLLISVSSCLSDIEFVRYCTQLKVNLTPYDVLALYLLMRREKLAEYLVSLPTDFSECPLTWPLQDLQVNILFLVLNHRLNETV